MRKLLMDIEYTRLMTQYEIIEVTEVLLLSSGDSSKLARETKRTLERFKDSPTVPDKLKLTKQIVALYIRKGEC